MKWFRGEFNALCLLATLSLSTKVFAVGPPITVGAEGGTGFRDGKWDAHFVVGERYSGAKCSAVLESGKEPSVPFNYIDEIKTLALSVPLEERLEVNYSSTPICPECNQRNSQDGGLDSIADHSLALLVLTESPDFGSATSASKAVNAIKAAMKKLKEGGRLILATHDEEFRFTTINRTAKSYLGLSSKILDLSARDAAVLIIW